ncbi:Plant disease resistance response protein [Corchorus capsularis]|uniref:Dirigent protein n=1 Tax=Corchorus capsularis TaxID=210143 RepID=A0A1R3J4X6_COCAP|nr:Plant disease resistance response protein [Corchorus capsularis]
MAKNAILTSKAFKAITYFLFLAIIFTCANSARLLDQVEPQPQVVGDIPQASNPVATTVPPNTLPSGQVPAATPTAPEVDVADPPLADEQAPVATPAAATSSTTGGGAAAAASATVANPGPHEPALSFFMHDILGGTHPSARVVTGVIANSEINGIPFSKTNNDLFPIQGASPLLTGSNINNLRNINNLINPNNVPFLTGLTGAQTNAILQNTGNNDNVLNTGSQPFVQAGQLPPGSLQRLMFGTITVIDDELTEAHELGSAVLGKAQGFYLASSLDGTSQTLALTVLLHGGDHGNEDAISFFGVHRTVSPDSQIAVVGGTGKYENARGYATVETLHQEDQHITDGVDTILHFNVYLLD